MDIVDLLQWPAMAATVAAAWLVGSRRALKRGERLSGQAPHLQRALDALRVAGRDAPRALRIDARELGVQRRPAARGGLGIDLRAYRGVGLRQRIEPADQRAVVEHRAADDERHLVTGDDCP